MNRLKVSQAVQKQYPHWQDTEYNELTKLDFFAQHLETLLAVQIAARSIIDQRLIEDLQRFNGTYTDAELKDMQGRSKVYMNHLRQKCNAGEAQISETAIPSSGKAWGISATPIPDLDKALQSDKKVTIDGQPLEVQNEQGETEQVTEKDLASREQQQAKEKAAAMELLIEDQLIECKAESQWRKVIQDGSRLGTGIVRSPIKIDAPQYQFGKGKDNKWQKQRIIKHTLGLRQVRPWDFYPDMTASTTEDSRFFFERDYTTKAELQRWANDSENPLIKASTRRLLQLNKDGNKTQHNTEMLDNIRALAGMQTSSDDDRYEIWTFIGQVPEAVKDEFLAASGADEHQQEIDELKQMPDVEVTYCGGIVLNIEPLLFDREQVQPYQVWNWEEDDTCIFGKGVLHLGGHAQDVYNTAWRMMLDNSAISGIPMIAIREGIVEPFDGKYEVKAGKPWRIKKLNASIKEAFETFNIESRQNENANVIALAKGAMDELTGVPMLQQGEQGPASQTLGGMSMLMNAANTVRRNQVMDWDHNMIKPIITGFYHYNMAEHDDDNVKGDYNVNAKGVSALLVREVQSQNIINMLNMASTNPALMPVVQIKAIQWLREWCQINAMDDSLIPTDDEIKQLQESQQPKEDEQGEGQGQDNELQAKSQLLQLEYSLKNQLAEKDQVNKREIELIKQQTELNKLQTTGQIKEAEFNQRMKELEFRLEREATLKLNLETVQTNRFNAELALKQTQGERANIGLESA